MPNLHLEFEIEGKSIGPNHPCFVIAEVGVNHNGDVDTALSMIDAIADAGADCVKFQTFKADEFINDPNEIYEYISQGQVVRESQATMFQRLELAYSEFSGLFDRARDKGLIPLSTPTERGAVDLLEGLKAGAFKIGSDDLVHTPLIEYVSAKKKPIILSAGMADAGDIERAIGVIQSQGNNQICLLHCVSLYPTPDDALNLNKITSLGLSYSCPIGFSDHSQGIIAALGAVALGASVVEKHFTLDKNMPGPDHRFSADVVEFKELVSGIRRIESALGTSEIVPAKAETEMRKIARRSIVAACELPAGHVISANDLAYQRPGTGLMPHEASLIIGCETKVSLSASEMIGLHHVKEKV